MMCGCRKNDKANVAKCWEEVHMIKITEIYYAMDNTLQHIQITQQNEQATIRHKMWMNLINKMSKRNWTQKNM